MNQRIMLGTKRIEIICHNVNLFVLICHVSESVIVYLLWFQFEQFSSFYNRAIVCLHICTLLSYAECVCFFLTFRQIMFVLVYSIFESSWFRLVQLSAQDSINPCFIIRLHTTFFVTICPFGILIYNFTIHFKRFFLKRTNIEDLDSFVLPLHNRSTAIFL